MVKVHSTNSPLWVSFPDAYLISFLIPRAVEDDIDNNGHLAEPYENPEPWTVNPHISRVL